MEVHIVRPVMIENRSRLKTIEELDLEYRNWVHGIEDHHAIIIKRMKQLILSRIIEEGDPDFLELGLRVGEERLSSKGYIRNHIENRDWITVKKP